MDATLRDDFQLYFRLALFTALTAYTVVKVNEAVPEAYLVRRPLTSSIESIHAYEAQPVKIKQTTDQSVRMKNFTFVRLNVIV